VDREAIGLMSATSLLWPGPRFRDLPGGLNRMSFHPCTRRAASRALTGFVVGAGLSIAGCSSEVGSSPSSKAQMKEIYARGGQSPLVRGGSGKAVVGPSNIKKRIFGPEAAKSPPEK
jgi:hypothetical protein